mgnify:CR=1 FL=1
MSRRTNSTSIHQIFCCDSKFKETLLPTYINIGKQFCQNINCLNYSEEERFKKLFSNKQDVQNSVETEEKYTHLNIPDEEISFKNVSQKTSVFNSSDKRLNTQETILAATQLSLDQESLKDFQSENKNEGQKFRRKQRQLKNSKERHRISKKTRLNKARRKRMEGDGIPFDVEEDKSLLLLQMQTPSSSQENAFKKKEITNFSIFLNYCSRTTKRILKKKNNSSDDALFKSSSDIHRYTNFDNLFSFAKDPYNIPNIK